MRRTPVEPIPADTPRATPEAQRLALAVFAKALDDVPFQGVKWFWSEDFDFYCRLIDWPPGDYRISLLRQEAEKIRENKRRSVMLRNIDAYKEIAREEQDNGITRTITFRYLDDEGKEEMTIWSGMSDEAPPATVQEVVELACSDNPQLWEDEGIRLLTGNEAEEERALAMSDEGNA